MGIEQQINQPDSKMEIFWSHMRDIKDKFEKFSTGLNIEIDQKLMKF